MLEKRLYNVCIGKRYLKAQARKHFAGFLKTPNTSPRKDIITQAGLAATSAEAPSVTTTEANQRQKNRYCPYLKKWLVLV